MLISKTSRISGKYHTMELPITLEAFIAWRDSTTSIQDAFPQLTPNQREFLLSGVTQEEWDAAFPDEDE